MWYPAAAGARDSLPSSKTAYSRKNLRRAKHMSKNPYVRKDPTTIPCRKCGGQVHRVLDERKYACIQCGRGYKEGSK
jgi:ribosomal protein L37E